MTVISKSSIKHFLVKVPRDMLPHAHRAQRKITGSKSLRHAQQVWNDIPVVNRKPRARPPKPRHHFIGNHQNSILVAQFPYPFQISIRRHQNPIRPRHRL